MEKLSDSERERCMHYLRLFRTDLIDAIHDSWVKTGSPGGGAFIQTGNPKDLTECGLIIPDVIESDNPMFRLTVRKPSYFEVIAVVSVRKSFRNDYTVLCSGPLSDCVLLSDAIFKARDLVLSPATRSVTCDCAG